MSQILADIWCWANSHTTECLRQDRCVCGTYDRQNADFEQRLKQAMERYPEQSNPQERSMELCDCRRPAPDRDTRDVNVDAMQCRGCRGWITGMAILENRWGFTHAELQKLFRGTHGQDK